jgi:plasmid stabilization system protein ParE
MSHAVTQRPRARLDLLEQFVYLGESASADVAHRYFRAVEETCEQLLAHPLSGTRASGHWGIFAGETAT